MGRLINPGLGELIDRYSILILKIRHTNAAHHFGEEYAAIEPWIRRAAGLTHAVELAVINSLLWHAEDELRFLRGELPDVRQWAGPDDLKIELLDKIRVCAFRIQELNDRRAELITLINANTGGPTEREKLR